MLSKDSVREGSPFFISISKTPLKTLEELLIKAKKYIKYENVLETEKLKMAKNHNAKIGTTQAKSDKLFKLDDKSTYKVRSKYKEYTFLDVSQGRILNEIMNEALKDVGLNVLEPLKAGNGGKD